MALCARPRAPRVRASDRRASSRPRPPSPSAGSPTASRRRRATTWLAIAEQPDRARARPRTRAAPARRRRRRRRTRSSRIRNVIGTDSFSAFWKSLSIVLFNSCVALATPNSATVKPGLACAASRRRRRAAAAPARRRVSALSLHVELDQLRVPVRARSWPARARAQVRHLRHRPQLRRYCADGRAERGRGGGVADADSTSTLSVAGVLNPADARIACARAVSPVACSASVSFTVPAALPRTTAATTKTIQIAVAVFQWSALQRPARWARFPRDIPQTVEAYREAAPAAAR